MYLIYLHNQTNRLLNTSCSLKPWWLLILLLYWFRRLRILRTFHFTSNLTIAMNDLQSIILHCNNSRSLRLFLGFWLRLNHWSFHIFLNQRSEKRKGDNELDHTTWRWIEWWNIITFMIKQHEHYITERSIQHQFL